MKCPNCGEELKEGYLYCEKCGEDIHIVPDFEPELEYSMHKSLKSVVEEAAYESSIHDTPEQKGDTEKLRPEKKGLNKTVLLIVGLLLFAVLITGVTFGILRYQYYSVDYQLQRAYACISRGETEDAIPYYERALEINSKNTKALFELAEIYRSTGNDTEYMNLLKRISQASYASEMDVEKAYEKMIAFYRSKENYPAINELLLECPNSSILNANQNYMANPPEFSYQEGTYAEVIPLKLSSNTSGVIYYTMDGSVPDENSEIYTAPIFLETGDYVVSAVFINDYGIVSNVVQKQYHIDVIKPSPPEVQVHSGEYTSPTMIVVDVYPGCTVYYTTDGSVPTDQSLRYQSPIPMPLGKSQYKFIAYNEEGVAGEVTTREYDLVINSDRTPEKACEDIVQKMLEIGKIYDLQGGTYELEGKYKYQFQYAVSIPDRGEFYMIAEVYEDTAGLQTKTGTNYAVDIYTGEMFKVTIEKNGNYLLEGF